MVLVLGNPTVDQKKMASDSVSAQTRSRISGLDSASECESRIRRELISVSDLCGGVDEIQDLLDEITLFGETGECMEMQRTGSRMTQDTWDSHQLQQPAAAAVDPRTLGIVCSWRPELLLSPLGLGELLLIALCVCCLVSIGVSGDPARGSPLLLPHAGHTRLAIFSCVFCALWTMLMLFVHITRIQYCLLINWSLLHTWLFGLLSAVHGTAAVLLFHQVYQYTYQYPHLSAWTRSWTTAAAVLCLLAGCCALFIALLPRCAPSSQYSLMRDHSTRTTLLSGTNAEDWEYRHPEPEPADALQNDAADSQHYLVNNPYIQWHVENGTFYLLPDELRQQLRRDSELLGAAGGGGEGSVLGT
ncbi:hypothetical protein FJT64_023719 [Amphibalanus amphitrite]|uniref:Uncharacterized protein n=2 Tax=Amphibalanus amphitrite TaxID=1232801 RepID=A0A6A4WQQ5_AMPAM|nr:hypothetical protein FJT64_023719 [Amphibalanus amphitrite]